MAVTNYKSEGPTRWGNQLNGNNDAYVLGIPIVIRWPHSLGQSVEWKLLQEASVIVAKNLWAPLAGAIS